MHNENNDLSIRILLIAPYTGLIKAFEEAIRSRKGMTLTSFESDTVNAPSLVRTLELDNYDIIISRGYTAQMISDTCGRQVLNVGISIYDALRTLQLAKNYSGKIAIVGFYSVVHYSMILKDILQYNVDIFTIDIIDEIKGKLNELKETGYTMVIGDVITTTIAKQVGLQTIVITTGRESIEDCLNTAQEIYDEKIRLNQRKAFYKTIISNLFEDVVVLNQDDHIELSSKPVSLSLKKALQKLAKTVYQKNVIVSIRTIDGAKYHIHGQKITYRDELFAVYSFHKMADLNPSSGFIQYYDQFETPEPSQRFFFSLSPSVQNVLDTLKSFQFLSKPIIIKGPRGSGKDQFVYYLNQVRKQNNTPLVIIDCKYINAAEWDHFINDSNSCIYESGFILYFKDSHLLAHKQRNDLLRMTRHVNLQKRNQLIFSYIPGESNDFDKSEFLKEIQFTMQAVSLNIPPLSERKEDLPNMITLYLNEFNQAFAKQIVGFTPDAMKLMVNYSWPGNLNQLKSAIQQLMLSASSDIITISQVLPLLNSYNSNMDYATTNIPEIPLNGTLDEITTAVIKYVLKEENGNQSQAAKRLNIGRSTLRRHLE